VVVVDAEVKEPGDTPATVRTTAVAGLGSEAYRPVGLRYRSGSCPEASLAKVMEKWRAAVAAPRVEEVLVTVTGKRVGRAFRASCTSDAGSQGDRGMVVGV